MTATNKLNNKAQYWGGKARESLGRLTGNRRTEYEGKLDQVKANLKDSGEKVKDALRSASGRSGFQTGAPSGTRNRSRTTWQRRGSRRI